MIKSILKGENLRRVFFAFLKENNAFYNYMNAFYNCHSSRNTEFTENPSFSYFLNRCSNKNKPNDLIYNAFDWCDTNEGNFYWASLHDKFTKICSQIKEEEDERNEDKKTIEDLIEEG